MFRLGRPWLAPARTGAVPRDQSARRGRYANAPGARGQTLVETAMVIPLFLVLLVAVIEFSFVFNALLSINYSSRNASLVGAEAGRAEGADCFILDRVERDVTAPADRAKITKVRIYRADRNGDAIPHDTNANGLNVYTRTGSTTCNFQGLLTMTVPYTLSGTEGYPDDGRCNILWPPDWPGLCITGTGDPVIDRTGVDTIGVEITYEYGWHTPLPGLIGLLGDGTMTGTGYTLVQSNAMRMEPIH